MHILLQKRTKEKGAALMIVVFFFVFISITILLGIVSPVVREFKVASESLSSHSTYFLAESGVEDAMYRIKNNKQIGATETLVLGTASATTTITDLGSGQKQISTLGDMSSRQRKVGIVIAQATGVSFNYGLQVGQGGIYLNSGQVIGNVYAAGPISASNSGGNAITGSVISANTASLTADQTNGVAGTPASTLSIGQTSGAEDLAQSFVVGSANPLNKIQLYIKKTGSPSNITVRIATDSGGSPSTNYIATGTVSASLVGSSYGWVDAIFTTNPNMQTGVTYWLVADTSYSASNYYTVGANTSGYTNGVAKQGQYSGAWSTVSPSTLDAYFNVYVGGFYGSISGYDQWNQFHVGTSGSGTAQAHTITATNAPGALYCQTGSLNNKSCDTSKADPVAAAWPVSDSNIQTWKDEATAGGVYTGDITTSYNGSLNNNAGNTLGPKKIVGNFHAATGWTAYISGTVWITGDLTIDGGTLMRLSSAYGSRSGVVLVSGKIIITGGGHADGSGTAGSYIVMVTTSDCPTSSSCGGANAISVSGGSGAVVLVASNGTIDINTGAQAKELTGYKVNITGNASVTYDTGLANLSFTSGPAGSWTVSSWQETQ